MKRMLAATVVAIFGLVPAMGSACEYNDDSAASAAAPAQLATYPAASKVPAPTIAKALAPKAAKPMTDKAKSLSPERKLAVVISN
jgi:hypothetical protein